MRTAQLNHRPQTDSGTDTARDSGTAKREERARQAEEEARTALARAAELAVGLGVNLDAFVGAAYASYLTAHPALREHIEGAHLLAHVRELRRRGGVAEA